MRIEQYDKKYIEDISVLIKNFHDEAVKEYCGPIDEEVILQTIQYAEKENVFLLIEDDHAQGILYGVRSKNPTGQGDIFQEVIWYVNPRYRGLGLDLLRYAEINLHLQGVSIMIMVALANSKSEKLARFYDRLGYKPMETHYSRIL